MSNEYFEFMGDWPKDASGGEVMTDIELVKACAKKMGYEQYPEGSAGSASRWVTDEHDKGFRFDPLNDDAQAMAMVKKLKLCVAWIIDAWVVVDTDGARPAYTSTDLNRAICEWVAKL